MVGGLPGRELVRQQPPGAATPQYVKDRVQDLARRMNPGSAETPGRRQKGLQVRELSVGQISQVGPPQGDIPAILPAKPACCPVFRHVNQIEASTESGRGRLGRAVYGRTVIVSCIQGWMQH
jgi:hypothetical protein